MGASFGPGCEASPSTACGVLAESHPSREVVEVANISGGKDSDCIAKLLSDRAQRSGKRTLYVFAETDNEADETYEHLDKLERLLSIKLIRVRHDFSAAIARRRERLPVQWSEAGISQDLIDAALAVMHPTGVAYLDLCISKGMFAAGISRKFCTEELKIRPCDEQVINPLLAEGARVVQWFGIRSDESKKRADVEVHPRFQRVSRQLLYYRPILDWTVQDVVEFHRKHGIPMNRLYAAGFSRVGCFPCVNERKGGMAIIARRYPQHVARIREWERIISLANVSWRKRENHGDIATFFPTGTVPGLHRNTIDDIAAWSLTARGGRQFDFLAGHIPDQQFYACTGGQGWCEAA